MLYRWTHYPTGKTGVGQKTFEQAEEEGGHWLIGHQHYFQPRRLYDVLIDHWNGLGGGVWKYELLSEPVSVPVISEFVLDWVI